MTLRKFYGLPIVFLGVYNRVLRIDYKHACVQKGKAREGLAAATTSVKVQRMSDDTFVVKTRASAVKETADKPRTKGKPRTKAEKKKNRIGKQRHRPAPSE
jgi:hypothetical protein